MAKEKAQQEREEGKVVGPTELTELAPAESAEEKTEFTNEFDADAHYKNYTDEQKAAEHK